MQSYLKKFYPLHIRGGFSDRNNLSSLNKEMQYDDFDEPTRNILYNSSLTIIKTYIRASGKEMFCKIIKNNVFGEKYTGDYYEFDNILSQIEDIFDRGPYYEILDLVEFFAINLVDNYDFDRKKGIIEGYIDIFNRLFESEYVGYRFINGKIIQITNKEEIESIDKASNSPYESVNVHLDKAISFISDKTRDYRNSIKESISALETLCSILTGDKNSTLGVLIKKITDGKNIHPCLKDAISKLYGFASDEPGIRHDNSKEKTKVGFEEAKLILVICSGLVNYLVDLYK